MNGRAIAAVLIAVLTALSSLSRIRAQSSDEARSISDAEVRAIIAERVDTHRQSPGIVVGVIDASGRRVISYGKAGASGDAVPLDGDTVFEIGSMSKVFTALLLTDAVQRGEVALTDSIAKYLPSNVKVPERGRAITLEDLANHTSGLPRLPSNMSPKDPQNPYADYSAEQLYEFLSTHQLTRDVGVSYEYSNLGAGLLGHILARRAQTDYESLVRTRITGPLGMTSTGIALTPVMRARLATGHDQSLRPTKGWDLPTLAGAGALRSSANDMLTFLAAFMDYTESPLKPAMKATLQPRKPAGGPNTEIALGWHIGTANGKSIAWHNGGTGGYRTIMGFDPAARLGVVVLTNAGSPAGPDDIARHLLDRKSPLLAANSRALAQPKARTEIKLDPAVFDRYVGRYQLAPALFFTVSREGSRFLVQLTGQSTFDVYPETDKDFFYKVVDAQLTFETDAQGKAVAVVLHQNGIDQRAPRIEGDPVVPKEVTLDPKVLEGFVGRYDFVPGISLTVTRQDNRLFAQLTGQPSVEIFASGPRDFFYKVVNAQLTFEVAADGRATAVILHQLGRDQRANRAN
jgi:CubicO group peptidase (beta-lactamase class C family)